MAKYTNSSSKVYKFEESLVGRQVDSQIISTGMPGYPFKRDSPSTLIGRRSRYKANSLYNIETCLNQSSKTFCMQAL
ncbi:hypothetical protein FBU30_010925, partial [Linnemannia zychae]